MKENQNTHVPFEQLDVSAKGLLFLLATMAMATHRPWPPTAAEIGADLTDMWNEERLAPHDLKDLDRMSMLIEQRLARYAVPKNQWLNAAPVRRRHR